MTPDPKDDPRYGVGRDTVDLAAQRIRRLLGEGDWDGAVVAAGRLANDLFVLSTT